MEYKRIKDLREEKFWTQKYVAMQLNISQRAIPLEILCQLADLYCVSTDYILERTNKKNK